MHHTEAASLWALIGWQGPLVGKIKSVTNEWKSHTDEVNEYMLYFDMGSLLEFDISDTFWSLFAPTLINKHARYSIII